MAKLYFRYGAMGSSKTANAIMVRYNYLERGQKVLMLKPKLDSRDGETMVASRCGLSCACGYMEEIDAYPVEEYDCVIVDEAQFLTKAQVEKLVEIVDDRHVPVIAYGLRTDFQGNLFEGSKWLLGVVDDWNVPVICYGLRADFAGQLFPGSQELLAVADIIEEVKTICWCGKKATCNARILDGKVIKDGAQVMLGGNESYVSLCRKHWTEGKLKP